MKRKAFTMIEMLVVISILIALSLIAKPTYTSLGDNAILYSMQSDAEITIKHLNKLYAGTGSFQDILDSSLISFSDSDYDGFSDMKIKYGDKLQINEDNTIKLQSISTNPDCFYMEITNPNFKINHVIKFNSCTDNKLRIF